MAADIQDLLDAVFVELDAYAAIATICGERVYNQQAGQNDALPLVVYDTLGSRIEQDMAGGQFYRIDLRIVGWVPIDNGTTGATGAGTLEDAIYDFMDRNTITATGFESAVIRLVTRGPRTIEEDSIRVQVDGVLEAYAPIP